MDRTYHKVILAEAQRMDAVADESVDLVVTSPPYPMIEMWDEILFAQNHEIRVAFEDGKFELSYELMHKELDKVWSECFRVLKKGGIACINIGDATRTLNKNFRLFASHARIIQGCLEKGFQNLPNIIWRKQTNAPNKFMGSGMLPPGAYVTLEHEFILIFRKGEKRAFKTVEQKENRSQSAYFWEERNTWFSDLWDIKGTSQKIGDKQLRERSAAYPLEIPYRLINMFSVQNDVVLDPFLGTGTTTLAAIASKRNSIGYDIDSEFGNLITSNVLNGGKIVSSFGEKRLKDHKEFVKKRKELKGDDCFKYVNENYGIEVVTRQELKLKLPVVDNIYLEDQLIKASYKDSVSEEKSI